MKTLKVERVYVTDDECVEDVCNARRLHSAPGYATPVAFEQNHARLTVKRSHPVRSAFRFRVICC